MTGIGLAIGTMAPDFQLPDHRGGKVRLSEHRNAKAVLLVFFPFAFTDVCASEFRELSASGSELHEHGVVTYGISCDSPYSLASFARQESIAHDLLSDFWPHGAVTRAYGLLLEDKGFAMRGSYLIDQVGRITWNLVHGPAEAREPAAYMEALATLA